MDIYDFENDKTFQIGKAQIINKAIEQGRDENSALKEAKKFYFENFILKKPTSNPSQSENHIKKIDPSSELKQDSDDKLKPRLTLQQISEMIQNNIPVPGIRDIPDELNKLPGSTPQMKVKPKPWENKQGPLE